MFKRQHGYCSKIRACVWLYVRL